LELSALNPLAALVRRSSATVFFISQYAFASGHKKHCPTYAAAFGHLIFWQHLPQRRPTNKLSYCKLKMQSNIVFPKVENKNNTKNESFVIDNEIVSKNVE
jgi:hypothetical protein